MTAITAVAQTGYRVAVTVSGMPISPDPDPVSTFTIVRDTVEEQTPVRGFLDHAGDVTSVVAIDYEVPLERPVYYAVQVTRSSGAFEEYVAGPLTITAPAGTTGPLPLLSDPITGETVPVTVETWPELTRSSRGTVLSVAGRPDPVVVSDVLSSPTSAPMLRTETRSEELTVRRLLEAGAPVHLRAPTTGVEDAYLAVAEYVAARLTNDAADARRRHQLGAQHVGAPYLDTPALTDTLDELATAVPTTLLDLSAQWPTLLAIAAADLESV